MRITRPLPLAALASVIACSIPLANAAQGDLPSGQGDTNAERLGQESTVASGEASSADSGKAQRPESAPEGIPAGSFLLFPQITVGALYDDNIYATRNDLQDDLVFSVAPSIEARSNWERHVLNLRAGGVVSRYRDHSTEDTEDYWLEAEGRYDLSKRSNLFGGARHALYHEDRESPDATLGGEPTLYNDDMLYAGASHRLTDRVRARIGGSLRRLDFRDTALNQDDRDRDVVTGGVWLGYELNPTAQLYMQGAVDQRNYRLPLDDGIPENRDSKGYRLQAGVKFKRGAVSGDAYVGHMQQNYQDASLKDVSAADFGGGLTWQASERTTVRALLSRSIEETTLDGASSYLYTGLSAGISHRARPNLTFSTSVGVSRSDYQGDPRKDDFLEATGAVTYDLTRQVFLSAAYSYAHRDSSVNAADFYRNQVSLTLGAYLYPRRQLPPSWETYAFAIEPAVKNRFDGLYIGLQAGHEALATNTVRENPGDVDDANFLGHDWLWGAFAGYGWTRDRWYMGVEADAERGNAGWSHYKSKANSPYFRVDKGDSYGLSLRLGRVLDNGTLLYGRAGLVRTEFDTLYDNTDATPPDTLVDNTFTKTGRRIGVGIEVPESQHLFWRMDYAYTDYGSYTIDYTTNQEAYNNADSALRLGIGYRFGNQLAARNKPVSFDHAGFYLGANLAHGGLGSSIDGIHREDGPATPYIFDVDFGNEGLGAGIFAGYGWMFGKWYLGAELEGEVSQTKWEHIRVAGGSPAGGRDFSVAKHDSYGVSGRLGYKLHSGTLVYARAGLVETNFQTIYERGNNAATYIDRGDRIRGKRYGVGADVPLTRDMLVRLDYSYTDYDSYGFTTTHAGGANGDTMNYANWESLFRLGLAVHF